MGLRVLVTRPAPGLAATVRRLVARGFEPIELPLSAVTALPVGTLAGKPDAVAVSSGNALRFAPPALLDRLRPLPCFAVGSATAKVARGAGFADVIECGGDARALAETVTATVPRGSTLAYPCGRVRRQELEATLGEAGLRVEAIETYDTVALTYAADELALRMAGEPLAAALFHAATSAEAFLALPDDDTVGLLLRNARLICISERVAAVLRAGGRPGAEASPIPTDDAMMDLLAREPG